MQSRWWSDSTLRLGKKKPGQWRERGTWLRIREMDPLLHLWAACLLWTDEVRVSSVCWSFPPKCMESGDYMRWLLQTTNHITYAHGNLPEMHKCCRYLCTKVSGKHFGSGINLLSVKTLNGGCASKWSPALYCLHWSQQFNTAESDTRRHFTAVCLYMRVDDDLQWSCECPRLHDMLHMTTTRRRDDKHVVGIMFIQYVNGNTQMSGMDEGRWRPDVSQLRNIYWLTQTCYIAVDCEIPSFSLLFFYSPVPFSSCTP